MDQELIFLIIVGMAAVTYLPRFLPAWWLANRSLPPMVSAWLRQVPVAVLAAMVLPMLITADNRLDLRWDNLFFWAAVPTVAVAWKTRNLFAAVIVGLAAVAVARYFTAC